VCHHGPVDLVRRLRAGLRRHRGHPLRNVASGSEYYAAGYREAALPTWGRASALRLRGMYACAAYGGSRSDNVEAFRLLLSPYPDQLPSVDPRAAARPRRRPFMGAVSPCTLVGVVKLQRTMRDPRTPAVSYDGSRLAVAPGGTCDLTAANGLPRLLPGSASRLPYPASPGSNLGGRRPKDADDTRARAIGAMLLTAVCGVIRALENADSYTSAPLRANTAFAMAPAASTAVPFGVGLEVSAVTGTPEEAEADGRRTGRLRRCANQELIGRKDAAAHPQFVLRPCVVSGRLPSKYTTNEDAAGTTIRVETPRRTERAGTYMPNHKTGAGAARHFAPNATAHSATARRRRQALHH
jgi:hypothetical protein